MPGLEDRADSIVATAAELARLQGRELEARALTEGTATLAKTGYDGWDGGTNFYTLMLTLPVTTYALVADDREELERALCERVSHVVRTEVGHEVTEVVVGPVLSENAVTTEAPLSEDADSDLPGFWRPGFFRLFISHEAANKAEAHRLKFHLGNHGIATFVAHEDIEPTKEWQSEIERALRTMDALVALLSPGFVGSRWCDQEVGFAIGRSKLVIPLRLGADPHGFIAKYQGVQIVDRETSDVCEEIARTLLGNPRSSYRMCDSLVDGLARSGTFASSKERMSLLETAPSLTSPQCARLLRAVEENSQVREAFGVPERIKRLVAKHPH